MLSVAEQQRFNAQRDRQRNQSADVDARASAIRNKQNFYIRSVARACGHFETYLSSGDCRQCVLAFHWRRYRKAHPDATPRGRSLARDAAVESGAKTYQEGPCKNSAHGVAPERWVSSRGCVQCAADRYAASRLVGVACA
jgi:hypothetical protein